MKTKLFLLFIAVVFIVSLSACGMSSSADGNSSDASSQTTVLPSVNTPEQTVHAAFKALKGADSNEFNQLVQYSDNGRKGGVFIYKNNKFFGDNLDEKGKEFMKSIFSNLSYKIEEIKENGTTATAKIKISNRDLSSACKDMLRYTDADNPLVEAIKNSDSKIISTDTEITLNKTDGKWKIEMNESLTDALCGGLLQGLSGISDSIAEKFKNIF